MVDATRGLGNGLLLPAGPLREPAERLREVDFVVSHGGVSGLHAREYTVTTEPVCFRRLSDGMQSSVDVFKNNTRGFGRCAVLATPTGFYKRLLRLA